MDAAPAARSSWAAVLAQLNAPQHASAAGANYTIIRGAAPVLDTVANPDEVARALRGTAHAWMLDGRESFLMYRREGPGP